MSETLKHVWKGSLIIFIHAFETHITSAVNYYSL